MSATNISVHNDFRWYLCQQTGLEKWSCVNKTSEEALHPFFYGEKPLTKAIPIYKWIPRIFDPFILHKSLHPRVAISM